VEDENPEWRGTVENVQTGQRKYFKGMENLVGFIREHSRLTDKDKSFERWGGRKATGLKFSFLGRRAAEGVESSLLLLGSAAF